MEHYSTGIKRSATLDPNIAKHPDRGVPLSKPDKQALVAFLKTLTEERLRTDQTDFARPYPVKPTVHPMFAAQSPK